MPDLRILTFGGEGFLKGELKIYNFGNRTRIINVYGPQKVLVFVLYMKYPKRI